MDNITFNQDRGMRDEEGMMLSFRKEMQKTEDKLREAELLYHTLFNQSPDGIVIISTEGNIIDLGVELGLVQKSGAFFSYGDVRLGQGRENAKEYLIEHQDIADEIEKQIKDSVIKAR